MRAFVFLSLFIFNFLQSGETGNEEKQTHFLSSPFPKKLSTQAYLDNSSMELYHGRLDKRPGAIAVRIRWYGDGKAIRFLFTFVLLFVYSSVKSPEKHKTHLSRIGERAKEARRPQPSGGETSELSKKEETRKFTHFSTFNALSLSF